MTGRYTTRLGKHVAAPGLTLVTTLVTFSGVSNLSSPPHAGVMLAHALTTTAQI